MKKSLALVALLALSLSMTACSSDAPADGSGDAVESGSSEAVQGEEITILTPGAGESIASPFTVTGTTNSPDATIHLEGYGVDGEINTESKWSTEADGSFDFGSTYYFIGGGGEGRIEVFLLDADGNEYDRAVVPVMFE